MGRVIIIPYGVIWILSSSHGGYSGLGGAVSQSILGACFDYGDMGYWSRDCPKCELVV